MAVRLSSLVESRVIMKTMPKNMSWGSLTFWPILAPKVHKNVDFPWHFIAKCAQYGLGGLPSDDNNISQAADGL